MKGTRRRRPESSVWSHEKSPIFKCCAHWVTRSPTRTRKPGSAGTFLSEATADHALVAAFGFFGSGQALQSTVLFAPHILVPMSMETASIVKTRRPIAHRRKAPTSFAAGRIFLAGPSAELRSIIYKNSRLKHRRCQSTNFGVKTFSLRSFELRGGLLRWVPTHHPGGRGREYAAAALKFSRLNHHAIEFHAITLRWSCAELSPNIRNTSYNTIHFLCSFTKLELFYFICHRTN